MSVEEVETKVDQWLMRLIVDVRLHGLRRWIETTACFFNFRTGIKKPQQCGFFATKCGSLPLGRIKPTLLNHPKHIRNILDHDPSNVGDGVDVVLGVVGEAGAGHQVEVFEDGVEAFADAVVEVA